MCCLYTQFTAFIFSIFIFSLCYIQIFKNPWSILFYFCDNTLVARGLFLSEESLDIIH